MYFHSGKLHYESVTFGWWASGQKNKCQHNSKPLPPSPVISHKADTHACFKGSTTLWYFQVSVIIADGQKPWTNVHR